MEGLRAMLGGAALAVLALCLTSRGRGGDERHGHHAGAPADASLPEDGRRCGDPSTEREHALDHPRETIEKMALRRPGEPPRPCGRGNSAGHTEHFTQWEVGMPETQTTLAAMALAMNNPPCEQHPTGGEPDDGTGDFAPGFLISEMDQATSAATTSDELKQGMYMLLALTLDLWRRNEYAFAALNASLGAKAFDDVDPEYATRISLHNRGLHSFENPVPGKTDWRSRAMMADQIVHRMLHYTEKPHRQYLQAAMARTDIFRVFTEECGHVLELSRLLTMQPDPNGEPHDETHE